jgi:uncharacterized membrane protein required for colicin V production
MPTPSLTTLDIVVLVFIALGALQGYFRRLSGEMARLIGTICAFVLGTLLHEPLGQWIASETRLVDREAETATYVLTVIAALVFWIFFHRIIKKLLQVIISAEFDKFAGTLAGTIRVTILALIIFVTVNMWPNLPLKEHFGDNSFFGRCAIAITPTIQEQIEKHQIEQPFTQENPGGNSQATTTREEPTAP